MPNYQKGKIYMITANNADEGDVYIGSTCEKLYKRMGHHRDNYITRRSYTSRNLFDKYGIENCFIKLIKDYPCNDKKELWDEEAKYIKETNCVNRFIPNRTKKQYVLDTKDKKKQYDKERRKTRVNENREYFKKYNENNKEKIKEYKKLWYQENKERLKEKEKNIHEASKVKGQSV